jgi:ubiquinone/menaquinone biosynthesis C-methylase UbiE
MKPAQQSNEIFNRSLVMTEATRTYLPAASHDWALPFYDPLVKLLGGDAARKALLDQAALQSGQRVLDVGCGTGTLATLVKQLHPGIDVIGIDPDPQALSRARRKAARAGVAIQFDRGFGDDLPYPPGSFDRVLSSFVYHHVPAREKARVLQSIRHVLKPGGEFHMLDFEGPHDGPRGILAHLLHSSKHLEGNSAHQVLSLLKEAGFLDPRKVQRRRMLIGGVAYYRSRA